jgi:hypothetical protein
LTENATTFKIILANEKSEMVQHIEDVTSQKHNNLIKENIKAAEILLQECYDKAKSFGRDRIGKIYVAKSDTHYKIPITLFDDKYGIMTITLPPKKSIESITVFVRNIDKGVLEDSIDHFDRIWEYLSKEKRVTEIK